MRSVVSAAKSVTSKKKSAKEKKKRGVVWESAAVGSSHAKKVNANKRRGTKGGRFVKKVPAPVPVEAEDLANTDTTLEATNDLQEISNASSYQFYLTPNPGKRKVNPNVPKNVSLEPTSASACDICECEHGTLGYFDGTGTVYCEECFEEYPPDELWWGGRTKETPIVLWTMTWNTRKSWHSTTTRLPP